MKSKWALGGAAVIGLGVIVIGAPILLRGLHALVGSGFGTMDALQVQQTRSARVELAKAKDDADKCDPLAQIAKFDFNHGNISEAKNYATQLLSIAPKIRPNDYDKPENVYLHDTVGNSIHTDYGVAIHDGNMVLGRIALREHWLSDAKNYLAKAGMTPGACTLNSFGPNMSLAQDLIDAGQRDTVLQYFTECRRFWGYQADKLDSWEEDVKSGGSPDFGANLYY